MSYVDMARSHVKQLLQEGAGVDRLVEDPDRDLAFRRGRVTWYVSVRSDGKRVKAWSGAVLGVKPTAALLREVNAANDSLECSRVVVRDDVVYVEGTLAVESATAEDLRELCDEVSGTADHLGALIAAVHGGETPFPDDEPGSCPECGGEG